MQVAAAERNPDVGMLAVVRNRRALISEVRQFDGEDGRLHLVRLDYQDHQRPFDEELIWELERSKELLEPNEIPQATDRPMSADDFDALVRAARWTAIHPYLDPDGSGPLERLPVSAPFHGAVQVDDYQLVPLLKALRMPRVNLMIADDVGLGKTIEAGLILRELLLRRRINRVLILTPAALRIQWRDEMWSKFSLTFDVVDRGSTQNLRRTLGIDANPWRCCSRIIASYHYLRQPDILEQFLSACRVPEGSAHLPWDLLIVDEVHNLMPNPFGEDSQLCNTLRVIAPRFEHRLFLTATPHNGHTRCFTGLLELLDPVRFTRTDTLRDAEKERVQQVVMRRLKREINERTNPPKFCTREPPEAIVLDYSESELALITAFDALRGKVRSVIASAGKKRRLAGRFAIEILGKRLLSGPVTFLDSWRRCKLGLADEEAASDDEVVAATRALRDDVADDTEAQERESTAASVIGTWMRGFLHAVSDEIDAVDHAAAGLGVDLASEPKLQDPSRDARFRALTGLIDRLLRDEGNWSNDERLVVFTEYKTTLDCLMRRLRESYRNQDNRFLSLYGGMDDADRESIKEAFNDPDAPVRVLVATDAASEGLNLQTTARFILHYDCPWNPSRLEQRNGRLDRHGQARDVHVYHFASEDDNDLRFISYLIGKVDQIREDLGATGDLFDEATHRCLVEGREFEETQTLLESQIEAAKDAASFVADRTVVDSERNASSTIARNVEALADEIDFDPSTARETLDAAMSIDGGRPQLTDTDELQRFRLVNPSLPNWKDIIDETVRKQTFTQTLGPLPHLSYSPRPFEYDVGGRTIFRPRVDTIMLHLGHPLTAKATSALMRRRFPGPNAVSRWTVRYADIPASADAEVLLHVEELGINELRETFHHWIRTFRFTVSSGRLSAPTAHKPAKQLRQAEPCQNRADLEHAQEILEEIEPDLRELVRQYRSRLSDQLREQLELDGAAARKVEDQRYQSRQGEVSELIAENTLNRIEREIRQLKQQRQQGVLFEAQSFVDDLDRSIELKQEELDRRRQHYEEVREQLARERERITKFLLPRRYTQRGEAQVFPVAVEIRLRR